MFGFVCLYACIIYCYSYIYIWQYYGWTGNVMHVLYCRYFSWHYSSDSHSSDIQKLAHYIPLVPMDLLVQTGLHFLVDPEQKHMPSWTVQDALLIAIAKICSIWRTFKDTLEIGLTQPTDKTEETSQMIMLKLKTCTFKPVQGALKKHILPLLQQVQQGRVDLERQSSPWKKEKYLQ